MKHYDDPFERQRFVNHIASLTAHIAALAAQVERMGGVPVGAALVMPVEPGLADTAQVTLLPLPGAAHGEYPTGTRYRRAAGEEPRVLRVLRTIGEATIEQIAEAAATTRNAMAQELGRHREAIERRRVGRRVLYSLSPRSTWNHLRPHPTAPDGASKEHP